MSGFAQRTSWQQKGAGAVERPILETLRESRSVTEYGADNSGASSALAAFTKAYEAAPVGSRIKIPPGNYSGVSGVLKGAKFVVWEANGQPSGGGLWSLPGTVEQGFPSRKITGIQQTAPDGDNKNSFMRDASHNGGTRGFVCANVDVNTKVGINNTNFEWGFLSVLDNYAAAGENVAVYGQGNRRGVGPTWASVFEAIDHTATNNPAMGLVGIEVDVRANGNDDNKNRIGVDVVADRHNKGEGAYSHTSYGVRVQNNADAASLVKVAYSVVANNVQVGYDTSEATVVHAAFRMAQGQPVAFDAGMQNQLKYDGTGLNYTQGDVSKVRLNGDGSIQLGGRMTIKPSWALGAKTTNLGVNKPGATSGPPATWLSLVLDGKPYWLPIWED